MIVQHHVRVDFLPYTIFTDMVQCCLTMQVKDDKK